MNKVPSTPFLVYKHACIGAGRVFQESRTHWVPSKPYTETDVARSAISIMSTSCRLSVAKFILKAISARCGDCESILL